MVLGIFSCSGLDDQVLPPDANDQIKFQSFEIDPSRNYILARIINDGPHTLTSCRLSVSFFRQSNLPPNQFILTELNGSQASKVKELAFLRESFLIREPLKPGYSTEVYYELKIDQLRGSAFYTKELIDLKGKAQND